MRILTRLIMMGTVVSLVSIATVTATGRTQVDDFTQITAETDQITPDADTMPHAAHRLQYEIGLRMGGGRMDDPSRTTPIPEGIQWYLPRGGIIYGLTAAVSWRGVVGRLLVDGAHKYIPAPPTDSGYSSDAHWECTQALLGCRVPFAHGTAAFEPLAGWAYLHEAATVHRLGHGTVYRSEPRNNGPAFGALGELYMGRQVALRSMFAYQSAKYVDRRLRTELLIGPASRSQSDDPKTARERYAGILGYLRAWESEGRESRMFYAAIVVMGPL